MVTVIGNNITIKLNSTDYTQYILSYSESGGEKVLNKRKTFGNNYINTITGRNDYTLELTFKYDTTLNMDTIFDTAINYTIEIDVSTKTITYSNAYPISQKFNLENDNIVSVTIGYQIPAANAGTYNKDLS